MAEPPKPVHYFDESTNRHLTVAEGEFGKIAVIVRFAAPGSSSRWFGDGTRKDKELTFAQSVGEEQERGTYFTAKAGNRSSKSASSQGSASRKTPASTGSTATSPMRSV